MLKDLEAQTHGQKYNIPIQTKQENGSNSPIFMERGNQVQFNKQEPDPFWNPMPKNTYPEAFREQSSLRMNSRKIIINLYMDIQMFQ